MGRVKSDIGCNWSSYIGHSQACQCLFRLDKGFPHLAVRLEKLGSSTRHRPWLKRGWGSYQLGGVGVGSLRAAEFSSTHHEGGQQEVISTILSDFSGAS